MSASGPRLDEGPGGQAPDLPVPHPGRRERRELEHGPRMAIAERDEEGQADDEREQQAYGPRQAAAEGQAVLDALRAAHAGRRLSMPQGSGSRSITN